MNILPFLILAVLTADALAQSVDIHRFQFGNTLETVGIEDGLGPKSELVERGSPLMIRTAIDFSLDPLAVGLPNGDTLPIVDRIFTVAPGLSALLHPRVLVSVDVPLHRVRLSDTFVSGAYDASSWKVGDMLFSMKVRLTPDQSRFNLAVTPYFTVPAGGEDYLVSEDGFRVGGRLSGDISFGRWKWFGQTGYSTSSGAMFLGVDHKDLFELGVGTFYRINSRFAATAEWIQSISLPKIETGQNPTIIALALRYHVKPVYIFMGGGVHALDFSNDQRPYMFFAGIKMPLGTKVIDPPAPRPAPVQIVEKSIPAPTDPAVGAVKEITSGTIRFDKNQNKIKPEFQSQLENVANIISAYDDRIELVVLIGHADPTGEESYNKGLSRRRAEAVKAFLVNQGIDEYKIVIDGYGEVFPKTQNEAEYEINRRVEFQILLRTQP